VKRQINVIAVLGVLGVGLLGLGCTNPPEPVDFGAVERRVYSQFGEDGVIEKIFEIIEPTEKYAVEFGAHNGIHGSNTRRLILDEGWSAFLIEGEEKKAKKLRDNYRDFPRVVTQQAWVYPGNIEILFEEAGVPRDLDLLVIDICSNDYYVWRAIRDYRPKVVMIEVNPVFPPPQLMVIDFHPMNYHDNTDYFGASLQSLYNLAKKKGYELVYHTSEGVNAFFVDAKYFDRFGIEDNSPTTLFNRPGESFGERAPENAPERKSATRSILVDLWDRAPQGRDGVPFAPGHATLTWDHLEIPKRFRFDR